MRCNYLRDDCGTAAVELALVAPLLVFVMFGAFELGNYFMSEHVLLKGVRDGSVYAARQDIPTNYSCANGTPTVPQAVVTSTENLVRTGQLSGGTDRLPNWSSATFTMTVNCVSTVGTTTFGGLYNGNGGTVPVITVTAQVPYRSILAAMGFNASSFQLSASEQTAATGL